ncbi:hypothetical protein T4E_9612 [Trichinella pseudospiralis]|uniref:Uncharacterized protein n=1 Tax=Trichinella pseudospiralis TaxID=6337 RepID=A0A0V0W7J5_TRIPS|nr:hypothetical protein T4E_9612 [Trichinella pseudospiralis]
MAPGLTKLQNFCYNKAVFAPAKRVLKNCQNAAVDMIKIRVGGNGANI